MLIHTLPAVLIVSVQQYVFMSADETSSFTEGLSFYAYRIYLRELTHVFYNLCETYFSPVSKGSSYLPAAIVRMRGCSELAPTHMSSRSSH